MGNVLTPADYGTVNTLLSLSVVVGVPSGIISALTATYTAKYHARGETFAIAAFMHGMLRVAAVLAAIVFVVGQAARINAANAPGIPQPSQTKITPSNRRNAKLSTEFILYGMKRLTPCNVLLKTGPRQLEATSIITVVTYHGSSICSTWAIGSESNAPTTNTAVANTAAARSILCIKAASAAVSPCAWYFAV